MAAAHFWWWRTPSGEQEPDIPTGDARQRFALPVQTWRTKKRSIARNSSALADQEAPVGNQPGSAEREVRPPLDHAQSPSVLETSSKSPVKGMTRVKASKEKNSQKLGLEVELHKMSQKLYLQT